MVLFPSNPDHLSLSTSASLSIPPSFPTTTDFFPHGVYPPGYRPKLSFLFYAGENGPRISDTDALCRDQPPRWAPASNATLKDAIQDERLRPPRNTLTVTRIWGNIRVPRARMVRPMASQGQPLKGPNLNDGRGFSFFFSKEKRFAWEAGLRVKLSDIGKGEKYGLIFCYSNNSASCW